MLQNLAYFMIISVSISALFNNNTHTRLATTANSSVLQIHSKITKQSTKVHILNNVQLQSVAIHVYSVTVIISDCIISNLTMLAYGNMHQFIMFSNTNLINNIHLIVKFYGRTVFQNNTFSYVKAKLGWPIFLLSYLHYVRINNCSVFNVSGSAMEIHHIKYVTVKQVQLENVISHKPAVVCKNIIKMVMRELYFAHIKHLSTYIENVKHTEIIASIFLHNECTFAFFINEIERKILVVNTKFLLCSCKTYAGAFYVSFHSCSELLTAHLEINLHQVVFKNCSSEKHSGCISLVHKKIICRKKDSMKHIVVFMASCKFIACTSIKQSGAIQLIDIIFLQITDCKFTDNFGVNGGALNLRNVNYFRSQNVSFTTNLATHAGGAVYAVGNKNSKSLAEIVTCGFYKNRCLLGGGLYGQNLEKVSIKNSTFVNHITGRNGSAIHLTYITFFQIMGCSVLRNSARENAGGIYMVKVTSTLNINNIFEKNRGNDGGCFYISDCVSILNVKNVYVKNRGFRGGCLPCYI